MNPLLNRLPDLIPSDWLYRFERFNTDTLAMNWIASGLRHRELDRLNDTTAEERKVLAAPPPFPSVLTRTASVSPKLAASLMRIAHTLLSWVQRLPIGLTAQRAFVLKWDTSVRMARSTTRCECCAVLISPLPGQPLTFVSLPMTSTSTTMTQ